jgi:hypothetical protein
MPRYLHDDEGYLDIHAVIDACMLMGAPPWYNLRNRHLLQNPEFAARCESTWPASVWRRAVKVAYDNLKNGATFDSLGSPENRPVAAFFQMTLWDGATLA